MIADKEVGEIWAKAKLPIVRDLIHKLVEEREKVIRYRRFYDNSDYNSDLTNEFETALHDFGIDPATFKEQP